MKNKITFIVLFLINLNITVIFASEEIIINGVAPAGIEKLETTINTHEGMPLNKGEHGLNKYCYKIKDYIVYSNNLLGYGYELSKKAPKNIKCLKTNKEIKGKNKLGIYIGMSKYDVKKLLKLSNIKNNQPIIWQSILNVKSKEYNLQTYLNMEFKKETLVWLSVFTTTTN